MLVLSDSHIDVEKLQELLDKGTDIRTAIKELEKTNENKGKS